MRVGDRARKLVSRGADPIAAADLSVPSALIRKAAARNRLKVCAAAFLCGVSVTLPTMRAIGFRDLTTAQATQLNQLAAAGVTTIQSLPADLETRLAIDPRDIANLKTILAVDPEPEPDMAWQATLGGHQNASVILPSRISALHSIVDQLAALDPAIWPQALDALRIEARLTTQARSLLAALYVVPASEVYRIIPLLASIMRLPLDQRETLERSGFPPVPSDPDRQRIYSMLTRAKPDDLKTVRTILTDKRRQIAFARIDQLLQVRAVRRFLGGLADRQLEFTDEALALPSSCDISVPFSCRDPR